MDLRYTEEEEAFRAEVRAWLEEVLPSVPPEPDRNDWAARRVYDMGWQRMLYDAGYAGINWPKEYGGRGATPTEHLIFLEETERARAPYVGMNFVGQLHAGPTLVVEATPEQKAFHLPGILKGEHVWCQGFSEPNAGSDLASLRCKAERDGDDYVINGQKIWTSYGHVAEYCEMLVRTDFDVPKHKGITWLIVPMDLPGIDIRPLLTMEGSSEFCEVFFDDVRVPVVNRVGDENDGWRVANVTLSFERGTAFVSDVLQTQVLVRDLAELARTITSRGATKWEDAGLRRDLGKIAAELDALWALTKRNISQAQRTGLVGPGGSAFKLAFTELRNRLGDLAMHLLDRASLQPRRHRRHPHRRADARPLLGALDDHRRRHVAGAAQHRRRARPRPAPGSLGRTSGLRAHHRPGRPPGRDALVRRRPLPDRLRARDRRRRRSPRPGEMAGARRDRRVLAAPARGRRRARARRLRSGARVPGAGPRDRARPARRQPPRRRAHPRGRHGRADRRHPRAVGARHHGRVPRRSRRAARARPPTACTGSTPPRSPRRTSTARSTRSRPCASSPATSRPAS